MLDIFNLRSGYGGAEILKGITMKVKAGEIVAIIGPNGAGKSTMLRSVFGLNDIIGGDIIFKDKDIKGLPTHELINYGISYVPQENPIFSNMTVQENLEMGAFMFKDGESVKRNTADVYDKFFVLKQKRHQNAATLSGGQQQMLAIARSLMQDPELLLLDEPSSGLSPKMMGEVFAMVQDINKQGVTVIMVEQNAKQAAELADRIYILENGSVALEGGREIMKQEEIRNVYFGGI